MLARIVACLVHERALLIGPFNLLAPGFGHALTALAQAVRCWNVLTPVDTQQAACLSLGCSC